MLRATTDNLQTKQDDHRSSRDILTIAAIAFATILIHLAVGSRYGFNRDELSVLEDARHLAWGYVAYPPVTPFLGRMALLLFGTSLVGFRLFAFLAQALAVFLTGLMAREMGGARQAQILAALAAVPFCLGAGTMMQYISFDYLAWVLVAYFVVRLLKSEDPRWFVAIGAAIGLGMLAKYTMLFFAVGLLVAILVTPQRVALRTKWPWLGLALSLLIFLPNLLWQAQHHFVSLDFLKFLHERDVRTGVTDGFLAGQFELMLLAFPLALAGLYFCGISGEGRKFRPLAWMFLLPLLFFLIARGRNYYLAPGYPMLYAAGSVQLQSWLATFPRRRARTLQAAIFAALLLSIGMAGAVALPIAPVNSAWWKFSVRHETAFPEEIGWPEFVANIAEIRDALPAETHARLAILAENYGEVGAINLYGSKYGLPHAISGVNSSWERGYGEPAPQTVIVVGFSREFAEGHFASCRLAGRTRNDYGVPNEETTERADIFVCGPPRDGWPAFWRTFQYFA